MAVRNSGGIREKAELLAYVGAGILFAVVGLACLVYYLWATTPARADADILSAAAKVIQQTTRPSGWSLTEYFPTSRMVYREGFAFTDQAGQPRFGEDEVSTAFFANHPVGADITVYYYPERPDLAVIEVPSRLLPKPVSSLGYLGTLGVVGGLLMAVWSGRRLWLLPRRTAT